MQHVGIGDDHVPGSTDQAPHVGRRITIVGVRLDVGSGCFDQAVQVGVLILRQRLGRKEVERASRVIAHDCVEDGQVIAEGLAGCRSCHDGGVLASRNTFKRRGLVRVEVADAARTERFRQRWVEIGREIDGLRRDGRQRAPFDDIRREAWVRPEVLDRLGDRQSNSPSFLLPSPHKAANKRSVLVSAL